MANRNRIMRALILGTALTSVAACNRPFDLDFRGLGNGFDTSEAALRSTAPRPKPDARGIISYPNYQVAVAERNDTVSDVAARVGLSAAELAKFNGIPMGAKLRKGEIIALPRRVAEPSPETGAVMTGSIQPAEQIDITTLAGGAIERAETAAPPAITSTTPLPQTGQEPVRHKVERGETAYSIARLYGVSVRALSEWNSLGTNLDLREGQFLLIPVASDTAFKTEVAAPKTVVDAPGAGSLAPTPPSAAKALPAEKVAALATVPEAMPPSPDLDQFKTPTKASKLLFPADGSIIRDYKKKKNDGIDIGAAAGSPVKAAEAGTVAAITEDTNQVPILVLRHPGNLLTVYTFVDKIKVKKGDTVARGQTIAVVRAGDPSFVHFEVRQGFDAVDPTPFLN